jgi:predicted homoserine dehydrogenase-like protein
MDLMQRLAALESREKPIRVGVIGTGDFGRSLLCQLQEIKGVTVPLVVDRNIERAVTAMRLCGWKEEQIIIAKRRSAVTAGRGKPVVLEDYTWMFAAPVDILVDCTGDPNAGAKIGYYGLLNGKHIASVNKEADAIVGPFLGRLAKRMGLVYALVAGDHPCAVKSLHDWAITLGLKVIAAGKGTKYYRDQPKAYSNSQIEMASAANMTGLVPDVPGLHFPRAVLADLPDLLSLQKEGGMLNQEGVVEAINCLDEEEQSIVDPVLLNSVFVVVTSKYEESLRIMRGKGGVMSRDGKRALLYRPFHLCGVEAPYSIIQIGLNGAATGELLERPVAEVAAVAQRDLLPGEILDGHGHGKKMVKGIIVRAETAGRHEYLPLGLANQVEVKEHIPAGTILTYQMLRAKGNSFVWKLRALADEEGK